MLVDRVAQVQRKFVYERRKEKVEKKAAKGKGKGKAVVHEAAGVGEEHALAFVLDERTAPCERLKSALEASHAGANIAGYAFFYVSLPLQGERLR